MRAAEQVSASVDTIAAPQQQTVRRRRITSVAAKLTAANVLGSITGFITGPLLARALGAAGRGDLQAIVVPLTLVPGVLGLGIPTYAYRTLPRGRDLGEVIGSLGLPLLLIGSLAAGAAVPAADLLAGGRPTVRTGLIVVFSATPLLVIGSLLLSSLSALERWRRVVATTLTPFMTALVGIVVLYAVGDLTVGTAAAVTIAGSLLSLVPGLPLILEGRTRFRPALAVGGIRFGLKSWVGGLALLVNGRLDQFLMITLVAPRELGLYAVAVTFAGASSLAAGALGPPLMTRIAAGETHLMAQAVRVMLGATVVLNLLLAAVAPVLLSLLFGQQFHDALPMALILLAGQVWLTATNVLSSALQADGAPMIPTVAELVALVITVGGLLLLLRPLGGVGAAIVSFAAYGTSFAIQVAVAHRRVGVPLRAFLVPTREDVTWAGSRLADMLRAVRSAGQPV